MTERLVRTAADIVGAIKRRVAGLGWTQEQVEDKAHLTAGHWAKIASGRRVPNLETTEKLLRAVGLGLGLVDLEETARSCSDGESQIGDSLSGNVRRI